MRRDSLTALLLVLALIAISSGLLFQTIRDWEYARWIAWGFSMTLFFLVWFPFFLVPYLKKRQAR